VGDVLSLTTPRTDDVLSGVTVPTASGAGPSTGRPSHLQEVQAELISRRYPAGQSDIPGVVHPQFSEVSLAEYIHARGGARHG
jgi:phospholipase C